MTATTLAKAKKAKTDKKMPTDKALNKGMQARERIISVAETLFNKHGVDSASMRDIAAAAKMQPSSMYYHFGSKEELIWAVWEKGGIELLNRHQERSVATDGNCLRRPYYRFARLAARESGSVRDAALALSGKHQGAGHRPARRL